MDFTPKPSRANPYAKAGCISKIFFCWLLPLFCEGYKKDLDVGDMYDTLENNSSKTLGDKLERQWMKQVEQKKKKGKGKRPSLFKALWGMIGCQYFLLVFAFSFSELIFRVAQSLILRKLLLSFDDSTTVDVKWRYIYAGSMSLCALLLAITFHPCCQFAFILSMRCRTACSALVYRKALRLSKAAHGKTTVGQITNLLSNDVNRFDFNLLYTVWVPLGALQMVIFSYFLYIEFGHASLTGMAMLLLLTPIQYFNGRFSTRAREQIAERTDERSRVMGEIVLAMKIIKQYTWEEPFCKVVRDLREFEVKALRRRLHLRGFYLSMYLSTLKLVIFVTVLAYVLEGHKPTADKVFFLASVYFTMVQSIIYAVPSAIAGLGEIFVSLHRIEDFLLLEEKLDASGESFTISNLPAQTSDALSPKVAGVAKPSVSMNALSASWSGDRKMHLTNINLKAEGDKIVVIVGPVGSGKTSLLHVLLGELPTAEGKCSVQGRITYAAQEPWVFAGDVRQNILFGREFQEEKYNSVVKVAALEDDFKQLEFGDLTLVGERGTSLSGGQKARVGLARALYQEADIYLLDDPLSAVDTKVSRQLFEKCIRDHLKGKLRILVTHQLQYLPQADHILVLREGGILAQGSHSELTAAGIDFVNVTAGDIEEMSVVKKPSVREHVEEIHLEPVDLASRMRIRKEQHSEQKATGAMKAGIAWEYLMGAESPALFLLVLIIFVLCQLALSGSDYWLSYWTTAEARYYHGIKDNYLGWTTYISVFSGIVGAVIIFNLMRAVGFFTYCSRISVIMHNRMFTRLVRAPAKFFDDNPSGRIMNRFTKDLSSMDELLPPAFFDMILIFSNVIGVFILIILSNYYAAVPTVVVLIILVITQRFYVCTARDVKRIEGITKSPVFTHSSATFHGLTTIRSAKAESILISQFDGLQDIHTASWFLWFSSARCFGIWVEAISVTFLTVVTFSFLVLQNASNTGSVGLAITSALSIAGWLQFGMRQSAEVENLMTAVERNLEYAKLESEPPLESAPDKKPPSDWPFVGSIRFSQVYLSYDDKDVLKGLTFDIRAREKIGVVGRTGAGKSSIIQALFRLTEPRGEIYIDDVNILQIGLHDLRRSISIIPQDPVLFSGTMRYNLDPFNQFSDTELWKVIKNVELKNAVPSLDYKVTEDGDNFSLGQRQLVCLARAILRQNRIIVMDEATANVDAQTDQLIQTTIRTEFANCSIITVAHRLHSVIDCDRILVLDNGHIKEYDHPHVLLQNPNGAFTAMVRQTGKLSDEALRKIAAETYVRRRPFFQAESVAELTAIMSMSETDRK